jgi:hypothetical protein
MPIENDREISAWGQPANKSSQKTQLM